MREREEERRGERWGERGGRESSANVKTAKFRGSLNALKYENVEHKDSHLL